MTVKEFFRGGGEGGNLKKIVIIQAWQVGRRFELHKFSFFF